MYTGVFLIIYDWQQLIGSALGIIIPILFGYFIYLYQKWKTRTDNLYLLEKIFVININGTVKTYRNIKDFLNKKLPQTINNIDELNKMGVYAISTAFFPKFFINVIDERCMDMRTGSGYLEDRLLQVIEMSKDFALSIDSLREQFEFTVKQHYDMASNKLNSQQAQNMQYKELLQEFKKVVEHDIKENIKTYLKLLIHARVTANTIRKLGIFRWKLKFRHSFRLFKIDETFKKYKNNKFDFIDSFIKDKADEELNAILKEVGIIE